MCVYAAYDVCLYIMYLVAIYVMHYTNHFNRWKIWKTKYPLVTWFGLSPIASTHVEVTVCQNSCPVLPDDQQTTINRLLFVRVSMILCASALCFYYEYDYVYFACTKRALFSSSVQEEAP